MAQQVSESELVLMKIIWKNGGAALYALIMEELEKEKNEWKNNTVLTLLSRLVEKRFLKVRKIGRRNEYVALVTEAEYQAMQTHSFLDKVYGEMSEISCRPYCGRISSRRTSCGRSSPFGEIKMSGIRQA